jgi:hypothetical protein
VVGGALAVVAAIAAIVAVLATSSSSTRVATPPAVAPATTRFPSPPAGSVVFAREDGGDVLALAVTARAHGVGLQASVVSPDGTGIAGLRVGLAASTATRTVGSAATACGRGCYRADVALTGRPTSIRVRVVAKAHTTTWHVALPATWPPVDAAALVARATRVWNHLHSLSYVDRLGSDSTHVVIAHWQIVAPDRLAYQVQHGGSAVIIGLQRWDRPQGGAWEKSAAVRLHQPVPFWVSATDAHVIGSGRFAGRAVWNVTFFDPRTPAWFLVAIDKGTGRTLDLHMVASAHFMHDSYGSFDAPIKIVPPAS